MKGATLSGTDEASIRTALCLSFCRRKYFRVEASPVRGSQAALPQPVVFRKSRVLLLGILTTDAYELTWMSRQCDEKKARSPVGTGNPLGKELFRKIKS